mmetsp:Transcript_1049/g.1804  ORF Transcript_1049/g.1804 Transcript_1049/m.1804 type:complete len:303 (-) Transcript_1049:286-1194(-)|eukprot:CAMPEP_0197533716 /NCGR_PEP_ID=MMETSP1318-20131121/44437_1 /TAXON_ID=552666 /ORGANISM="Partenskyella glossopodia, Strain RCC365" /LENGTH=302 /DNA_ID=CAMNT_0043090701 /DNA_START=427 /DNA_END=1335 /DNA_ORIENTATION=+
MKSLFITTSLFLFTIASRAAVTTNVAEDSHYPIEGACERIDNTVKHHQKHLFSHALYKSVNTEKAVLTFMKSHVFAVWDFQSLIKALQLHVTGVGIPWRITPDREARRLMNEIVTDEESDAHPEGGYASHLEIYIEAMEAVGADTKPIKLWIELLADGVPPMAALKHFDWPPGVAPFVKSTFKTINGGKLHEIAAAFCKGREDIIPAMFKNLMPHLLKAGDKWNKFKAYLDLHIKTDGERHGPMARAMFNRITKGDDALCAAGEKVSVRSLTARYDFWTGLLREIEALTCEEGDLTCEPLNS